MIRSFDWRDVGLVRTLSSQGVCLDSETSLTRGHHPLQSALLAYLMPGIGATTLVWKANGNAVFGQVRCRAGENLARMLFIAPGCAASPPEGWPPMVEQLAAAAGEYGAHNLIAEVDEISSEYEALRAAGFAVYARQSLWKLSGPARCSTAALPLRATTGADDFGVHTLYANIVPRLVQQVEPPPEHPRGFVLEQQHEIIAFLHVRHGPNAHCQPQRQARVCVRAPVPRLAAGNSRALGVQGARLPSRHG